MLTFSCMLKWLSVQVSFTLKHLLYQFQLCNVLFLISSVEKIKFIVASNFPIKRQEIIAHSSNVSHDKSP